MYDTFYKSLPKGFRECVQVGYTFNIPESNKELQREIALALIDAIDAVRDDDSINFVPKYKNGNYYDTYISAKAHFEYDALCEELSFVWETETSEFDVLFLTSFRDSIGNELLNLFRERGY